MYREKEQTLFICLCTSDTRTKRSMYLLTQPAFCLELTEELPIATQENLLIFQEWNLVHQICGS